MHVLTQLVVGLSSITIAGALIRLACELQRVRKAIENKRRQVAPFEYAHTSTVISSFRSNGAHGGFAIYVYRNGSWHLEADLSAPGCEVTPPAIKGSFDGQVVKKEATSRK